MILSNKKLQNLNFENILNETENPKVNIIHKTFLKYILGVNKNSPTMAILGETGETPLLMNGFRRLINFWYRVRGLPDNTLAKKALLENVQMRSNWIRLVE